MSAIQNQPPAEVSDRKTIVADSLALGVIFAIGLTAFQRIIGFLRSVLFCRYLPEEELGSWSLAWSFLMLLAPLAVLGLPGTFGRYVEHFRQRGQLKTFLTRIGWLSLLGTGSLVAGLALYAPFFANLLFRNPAQTDLVWALVFGLLLVGALNFVSSIIEALRQVRLVTIMRFISGVSFAILALVFVFVWDASAVAVTVGFGLSCLIGAIPAVWFLTRYWNDLDSSIAQALSYRSMWARIAPFAAWLWLTNLATNMYEVADRYMLLQLLPLSAAEAHGVIGQYHSARVVPLLMVSLAAVLGGILLPYISAAWEEKRYRDAKIQLSWTLKITGLTITLFGVAVSICAPFLFNVILQGRYSDGLAVLPMTLTYCVWYSLVLVGQDFLWCKDQGKWLFIAYVVGLGINLVLNFLLIPSLGLSGAVWGTFISNLICLACVLLASQWHGFPVNRGIWIASAAPLIILLDPIIGLIVLSVLIWAGIQYRWIFDQEEVAHLISAGHKTIDKLGFHRLQRVGNGVRTLFLHVGKGVK